MKHIRSLLFHMFFFTWLTLLLTTSWVLLPFPRAVYRCCMRNWARVTGFGLWSLAGIRMNIEGRDKIPAGAALVACNHQSIWETFFMFLVVDDPQYVLKKELLRIPFWGWYARKCEQVPVDRSAGSRALKDMVAECVDRLKKGRQVVIFPQGTRTAPGTRNRYHPGVAAIYQALPEGVPVIPMALNSGVHWGRRRFLMEPGTIHLQVLDPIPPGLDRKTFMARLENTIETASDAMLADPEG